MSIISLCKKDYKQLRERFLKENTVLGRDAIKGMKRVAVIQHNALLHPYFTMTFNLIDNNLEDPTLTHQSDVEVHFVGHQQLVLFVFWHS